MPVFSIDRKLAPAFASMFAALSVAAPAVAEDNGRSFAMHGFAQADLRSLNANRDIAGEPGVGLFGSNPQ